MVQSHLDMIAMYILYQYYNSHLLIFIHYLVTHGGFYGYATSVSH